MKIFECSQRDDIWYQLRMGVATASNFAKILTPGGELSKSSRDYANLLIAERLLNQPLKVLEEPTYWMERGNILEQEAADLYEMTYSVETKKVGFVLMDNGLVGASPDRFVGDKGLLEIKCPAPWTHIGYLMAEEIDPKHKPQVQGQIYVAEKEWSDWWSYFPALPPACIRTYRDEKYLSKLGPALDEFTGFLISSIEWLAQKGLAGDDTLKSLPKPKETILKELTEFVP